MNVIPKAMSGLPFQSLPKGYTQLNLEALLKAAGIKEVDLHRLFAYLLISSLLTKLDALLRSTADPVQFYHSWVRASLDEFVTDSQGNRIHVSNIGSTLPAGHQLPTS